MIPTNNANKTSTDYGASLCEWLKEGWAWITALFQRWIEPLRTLLDACTYCPSICVRHKIENEKTKQASPNNRSWLQPEDTENVNSVWSDFSLQMLLANLIRFLPEETKTKILGKFDCYTEEEFIKQSLFAEQSISIIDAGESSFRSTTFLASTYTNERPKMLLSATKFLSYSTSTELVDGVSDYVSKNTDMQMDIALPAGTQAALVHSLLVKTKWLTPFEPLVEEQPFSYSDGMKDSVPMMKRTEQTPYCTLENGHVIWISGDDDINLILIVPFDTSNRANLHREIEELGGVNELHAKKENIQLIMPSYSMTTELNVKNILEKQGVPIDKTFNCNGIHQIDAIVQKARIEVTATGLTAAAATAAFQHESATMYDEPPKTIRVDKSFDSLVYWKDQCLFETCCDDAKAFRQCSPNI